jgi:hypothetical protein
MNLKLIFGLVIFVSFAIMFIRYPKFAKEFSILMGAIFLIYIIVAFVVTKYQEEH